MFLTIATAFISTLAMYSKGGSINLNVITSELNVGLNLLGQNGTTYAMPVLLTTASYNQQYYITAGNILLLITMVLVLLIIGIEKRVAVAVEIIEDCSRVFNTRPKN